MEVAPLQVDLEDSGAEGRTGGAFQQGRALVTGRKAVDIGPEPPEQGREIAALDGRPELRLGPGTAASKNCAAINAPMV